MENYVDFAVQKAVELLAIDSPTGYTAEAEEFVLREFRALGFAAERTAKGGILIDLGGESTDDALLLEAHADTLGGMVAEIKGDGRLRIVNVGGMNANNAEAENCRVVTKFSGQLRGHAAAYQCLHPCQRRLCLHKAQLGHRGGRAGRGRRVRGRREGPRHLRRRLCLL